MGLSVCCTTVPVLDSDAAGQHTLNGSPVESGEDGWRETCSFQPAEKVIIIIIIIIIHFIYKALYIFKENLKVLQKCRDKIKQLIKQLGNSIKNKYQLRLTQFEH